MNPQQILERLTLLGASMTKVQRYSLLGAFVAVVALVSGSTYMMNRQENVLLFSDLDAASASDIMTKLKAAKVEYELTDGGRSIRVPKNRADELRIDFASQGLPNTGRIGFEIFDKVSFGATEFIEQVNFRRALEGEIARTISTLAEVESARVHITVAKTSLFETREQPAKASVVLKLKSTNRSLSASAARGICALVAGSVEGLRPEAVALLDSYGRSLVRNDESNEDLLSGRAMERQLALERDLSAKLVELLDPVVGPGRARVNVAVRLNAASEEQTEERWDPAAAVVRSRQTTTDATPLPTMVGGVAGARMNMPDTAGGTDAARPASDVRLAGRSAETTNFEISRTTRHVVRPQGEVARLSVAVILDDQAVAVPGKDGAIEHKYKRRDPQELQKIQSLVAAAVGIDASRGDQLSVDNISFEDRLPAPQGPKPTFWESQKPQMIEFGKIGGLVLFGLIAFSIIMRPIVKRMTAAPPPIVTEHQEVETAPALPGPAEPPKTVADLEGEIEAELEAAELATFSDRRRIPILAKRLGTMTKSDPERAARLIRTWLQEDRTAR